MTTTHLKYCAYDGARFMAWVSPTNVAQHGPFFCQPRKNGRGTGIPDTQLYAVVDPDDCEHIQVHPCLLSVLYYGLLTMTRSAVEGICSSASPRPVIEL